MIIVHRNRNLKQQQTASGNKNLCVNGVCAYKLLVGDPLAMKLGTLIHHDKCSVKQKLQGCKQQETASGKNDF